MWPGGNQSYSLAKNHEKNLLPWELHPVTQIQSAQESPPRHDVGLYFKEKSVLQVFYCLPYLIWRN